ncbi:MAG TPA: glycoside hydrolase family 16 protein [Anaerolineales bacterium]|nr:glycoside hydrolase family 16 protein [Anaerolineales bacterium]
MPDKLSQRDFPANLLEKTGYRLEFSDEFDGPGLDTDKWFPFYLPHWSSRAQSAPDHYFKDGNLILQITKDQGPWCPEFDGEVRCSSIQTGEFAGAVGSKLGQLRFSDACIVREAQTNVQKYTPQYGYFELRAKGVSTSANHAAFWMIGYEDVPERSGEIAICELVGSHTGPTSSGIRFGVHPWGDKNLQDEFYEEFLNIDAARYHIYGLEWTPTHLDFYVDNAKIKTIHQSPRYPMQFMLGLYEHPFEGAWTGIYDPSAPYPKKFTIDYFRAYQPDGGYFISGTENE